jgi:hypothetical protein
MLSGEGWSGRHRSPPYVKVGTLLVRFTFGARQSGLLYRLISKHLKPACASEGASSAYAAGRMCLHKSTHGCETIHGTRCT